VRTGAGELDRIGMQLYSLRDLFQVDMVKTLRQLNAIGYDEVELASFGQRTATEVRAALDKTHLSAPSAHVSLQALRENLSLVLGNAKILEVKYIVCPWIDEEFRNPAGYRQVAAMLNQAGNVARRAGHLIAYHNQDYEFAEVNGERGYDILLEELDPEVVKMEMDIYWITKGGGDPLAYFKKYPGRFHMLHLKDMATDGSMTAVGTGRSTGSPSSQRRARRECVTTSPSWMIRSTRSASPGRATIFCGRSSGEVSVPEPERHHIIPKRRSQVAVTARGDHTYCLPLAAKVMGVA
jgi:sugar phosphate isomerase/epimerase